MPAWACSLIFKVERAAVLLPHQHRKIHALVTRSTVILQDVDLFVSLHQKTWLETYNVFQRYSFWLFARLGDRRWNFIFGSNRTDSTHSRHCLRELLQNEVVCKRKNKESSCCWQLAVVFLVFCQGFSLAKLVDSSLEGKTRRSEGPDADDICK